MKKRHQHKASAKKTRTKQHRKNRRSDRQSLSGGAGHKAKPKRLRFVLSAPKKKKRGLPPESTTTVFDSGNLPTQINLPGASSLQVEHKRSPPKRIKPLLSIREGDMLTFRDSDGNVVGSVRITRA